MYIIKAPKVGTWLPFFVFLDVGLEFLGATGVVRKRGVLMMRLLLIQFR